MDGPSDSADRKMEEGVARMRGREAGGKYETKYVYRVDFIPQNLKEQHFKMCYTV